MKDMASLSSYGAAMSNDDQFDPWGPGKRGFKRGVMWGAAILFIAWMLGGLG